MCRELLPHLISLCFHTRHGLGLNVSLTSDSFWQHHSTKSY